MENQHQHKFMEIMGPAFLVSVAYLDPGNWATAIEGGSRFGYELIWVVILSNLIAILLQSLAAKLGIVSGKHLAQICREQYPLPVCFMLWLLCEISIVALDLTMVLGTAVGLNLLFQLPLLPCILLTSLDALIIFLMVPGKLCKIKWSEIFTIIVIAMVLLCFLFDVFISAPPLQNVLGGLRPHLDSNSINTAVSLLGANVMPHNFYLHSALVKGRDKSSSSIVHICRCNFIDIAFALGIALLINLAVLIVSASTFHSAGVVVETLQDAHDLMEKFLSSNMASAVFGLALLLAGQLSTFTGTISGQIVLKGFLNIEISPWLRRLVTRMAAIIPAATLQFLYGDHGTYRMLVIAQVILAMQLPFTLIPLIKATSDESLMGVHANGFLMQTSAWSAVFLIFLANFLMFINVILSYTDISNGFMFGSVNLLENFASLFLKSPIIFICLMLFVFFISIEVAILSWMILKPISNLNEDKYVGSSYNSVLGWHQQPLTSIQHHITNIEEGQLQRKYRANEKSLIVLNEIITEDIGHSQKNSCPPHSHRELHYDPSFSEAPIEVDFSDNKDKGQIVMVKKRMGKGCRRQICLILDGFWAARLDSHGNAIMSIGPAFLNISSLKQCIQRIRAVDDTDQIFSTEHEPGASTLNNEAFFAKLNKTMLVIVGTVSELDDCRLLLLEAFGDDAWEDEYGQCDHGALNFYFIFGIWCILQIMDMCRVEPRPELWGRYASILNKLQWFLNTISDNSLFLCNEILVSIQQIQKAVIEKRGPKNKLPSTVAFPKGKEILFSVLKRYMRKLSVKTNRKGENTSFENKPKTNLGPIAA